MTGYRRMRRHARQARRAGMQPMMVINPGDQLPELAAVIIARWAWRYRSELAPLGSRLLPWRVSDRTRTPRCPPGGRSSSPAPESPPGCSPPSARGSASPPGSNGSTWP